MTTHIEHTVNEVWAKWGLGWDGRPIPASFPASVGDNKNDRNTSREALFFVPSDVFRVMFPLFFRPRTFVTRDRNAVRQQHVQSVKSAHGRKEGGWLGQFRRTADIIAG